MGVKLNKLAQTKGSSPQGAATTTFSLKNTHTHGSNHPRLCSEQKTETPDGMAPTAITKIDVLPD